MIPGNLGIIFTGDTQHYLSESSVDYCLLRYIDSPAVMLQNETKMAEGPRVPKQSERTEEISQQTYDHPIYREISCTNGKINKMKKEEVKRCLVERGLDSRWVLCNF